MYVHVHVYVYVYVYVCIYICLHLHLNDIFIDICIHNIASIFGRFSCAKTGHFPLPLRRGDEHRILSR